MKKIVPLIVFLALGLPLQALRADALKSSVSNIVLDEKNANTPELPINVALNGNIKISLQGKDSYSPVYSSGSGSEYGYRWELEKSSESNILTELTKPEAIVRSCNVGQAYQLGWSTESTGYTWVFTSKQLGIATLTFKKYYYSNAMVRNSDGSLLWKDPVETIQFTINVVDDGAPGTSASNN